MNTEFSSSLSSIYKLLLIAGAMGCIAYSGSAKSEPSTVAFAEVSPQYQRTRLDNGRYQPETYAFGKGVCYDKGGKDDSLNTLTFREIGNILAEALEEADYYPTPSPEETDLVIVVSWGKTIPPAKDFGGEATTRMANAFNALSRNKVVDNMGNTRVDENDEISKAMMSSYEAEMEMMLTIQRMQDNARWQGNLHNAKMLGYDNELLWAWRLEDSSMTMRNHYNDLLGEIEHPRYFVILQAYDFQALWKEKKKVMLWTTRFSIRAKGRQFDEELRNMALAAGRTFGTETENLVRGLTPARVELGELEYIGVVNEEE